MSANVENLIPQILAQYGLSHDGYVIEAIGTGHIHNTFSVSGKKSFILQRVNKNVFKSGKTRVEFMRNNQGGIQNILVFSKGEFLGAQKTE